MKVEMIGKKYGKLTVVSEFGKDHRGYRYNCECDCGRKAENVSGSDLRSGHKTSCGCNYSNRKKTHGMSGTRIHHIWGNMKKRCDNKNNKDYHNYGGRGISYCDEWKSFENFWSDMKGGYDDHLTLDRIDVNGNYTKENCRWVELKTQHYNKRNTVRLEYKGNLYTINELAEFVGMKPSSLATRLNKGFYIEDAIKPIKGKETITYNNITKTVSEWAEEIGMTYIQLKKRLMRGWTVERALTEPLRKRGYHNP